MVVLEPKLIIIQVLIKLFLGIQTVLVLLQQVVAVILTGGVL
jgi:hypothetical protein